MAGPAMAAPRRRSHPPPMYTLTPPPPRPHPWYDRRADPDDYVARHGPPRRSPRPQPSTRALLRRIRAGRFDPATTLDPPRLLPGALPHAALYPAHTEPPALAAVLDAHDAGRPTPRSALQAARPPRPHPRPTACLHCPSTRTPLRWGSAAGRQRYRCPDCRRTFSDLTGTPAAYLKKLPLWPQYLQCLHDGLSVRAAAARTRVHPTTAFRWRHRLLHGLLHHHHHPLTGWVELLDLRLPYSEKGRRTPPHPAYAPWSPRRRGHPRGHAFGAPNLTLLLAASATGVVHSASSRHDALHLGDVRSWLTPRLAPGVRLVAHKRRLDPFARFAAEIGAPFWGRPDRDHPFFQTPEWRTASAHELAALRRAAPPAPSCTLVFHYASRLRWWLTRFRGVASAYLDHYLAWHRWLHHGRLERQRAILQWSAG
jgi:transposase-like protein